MFAARVAGGARGHPDCPTLVIIVFDAIIVLFSVLSGVRFNGWTIFKITWK